MMLQFECWPLDGRRVIVEWRPDTCHDFWWGRWRPVKWLFNPEHQWHNP